MHGLEAAQALASDGVQEAQVRSIVQGLVDDGEMYRLQHHRRRPL